MCWLWFLCGWHKRQTCPLRNCSAPWDLPIHLSTLLSPSASSAVDTWSCSMPAANAAWMVHSGFCRQQTFPAFASTDGLASLSRCSPVKKLVLYSSCTSAKSFETLQTCVSLSLGLGCQAGGGALCFVCGKCRTQVRQEGTVTAEGRL